jgi:hypothetical protein
MSLVALIVLAGCNREEVRVYRVAKEQPAVSAPVAAIPEGHPEIPTAKPQLSWTLPPGWTEAGAGQMSVATFNISGKNGQQAQVAITPLRGLSGKEALIVNMWRKSVGQSDLTPEEVMKELQPVDIGGEAGKIFEVSSPVDVTTPRTRIVTAMTHRADASWFYKLAGDEELVESQKPAFVAFLKSIKITDAPITEPTPPPGASDSTVATQWKAPADWKAVTPGPMQTAKFAVPGKNSAKADVTVSIFPNSTGGTLANVNRWRNQIGLPPTTESELPQLIKPLDETNSEAVLVDMKNNNRQLIGAVVPRGGQWYFYKMLGDAEAVTAQKDAFTTFAKTQPR